MGAVRERRGGSARMWLLVLASSGLVSCSAPAAAPESAASRSVAPESAPRSAAAPTGTTAGASAALSGSCTSPSAPGQRSLVAYGDSLTHGDSDPAARVHRAGSWYSWLVCSGRFDDGGNEGVSGQTAAQVLARLQGDHPHADVLVVAAGTNDLRLGTPLDRTVADLDAALVLARQAAPTVLLATVQPWTGTDATALNAAVRRLAEEHGVRLVDFAGTLSQPGATVDGVHPTTASAQRLADLVAAAAG